jgi:DNA-binding IclR family transcriptional regulator
VKTRLSNKSRKTQLDGVGSNPPKAYSIEVLTRAINVLSVFGHARPQLSLSEIVAAVRLPKTTVFRLLSSLVERDLCEFDPSGKYSLILSSFALRIRRRQTNVHDVAPGNAGYP